MPEKRIHSVNDAIIRNFPVNTDWSSFDDEELVDARSAFGAKFGTRIQRRADILMDSAERQTSWYPLLSEIEARAPELGDGEGDQRQHMLLLQKLSNVRIALYELYAEAIAKEEEEILGRSITDQVFIDYIHLSKLCLRTNFQGAGFSYELPNPPKQTFFFKHNAGGIGTLIENISEMSSYVVPTLFRAKTDNAPGARRSLRIGRNSYVTGADNLAKSNLGAIAKASESFSDIQQMFDLDLANDILTLSPAFAERLRTENDKVRGKVNGCPMRRSGALLMPYAEYRFDPHPLAASYKKIYGLLAGPGEEI